MEFFVEGFECFFVVDGVEGGYVEGIVDLFVIVVDFVFVVIGVVVDIEGCYFC